MFKGVKKIFKKIRDLIFPVFCLSCEQEGEIICPNCLDKVFVQFQFFCPVCYKNNFDGLICRACQDKSFLDGAVSFGLYKNKTAQKAILEYKYSFNKDVFIIFEKIINEAFLNKDCSDIFNKDFNWLIVPVPLHSKRLWERGFNQAEELAVVLSKKSDCLMDAGILKRIRETKKQVGLGRVKRGENLTGAFTIKNSLNGRHIILVDDVFTTGATLQECAKELKKAGAGLVKACTLLREE